MQELAAHRAATIEKFMTLDESVKRVKADIAAAIAADIAATNAKIDANQAPGSAYCAADGAASRHAPATGIAYASDNIVIVDAGRPGVGGVATVAHTSEWL
jgi:hypothetical protein